MSAEVLIAPDGTVRFIYSDALAPLANGLGRVEIARASHVEPTREGLWTADMSPVHGPILGPFALRAEALAAEVQYLIEHGTPVPERS